MARHRSRRVHSVNTPHARPSVRQAARVVAPRDLSTSCLRARRMGEDRSISVDERSSHCRGLPTPARRRSEGRGVVPAERLPSSHAAPRQLRGGDRRHPGSGPPLAHAQIAGSRRIRASRRPRKSQRKAGPYPARGHFRRENGPGRRRFRDPAEGMFQWNPPASPPPSFGAVQGRRGQVLDPCRACRSWLVCHDRRVLIATVHQPTSASRRCGLTCSIRRGPSRARPWRHIASAERIHSLPIAARDPEATPLGADRGELVPIRSFRLRGLSVDRWHGPARAVRGGDRRAARGAHRRRVQVGTAALCAVLSRCRRTARRSAYL